MPASRSRRSVTSTSGLARHRRRRRAPLAVRGDGRSVVVSAALAAVVASLLIVGYVVGLPPFGSPDRKPGNAPSDVAAGTAASGWAGRRDQPTDARARHSAAPVEPPPALVPSAITKPSLSLVPGSSGRTNFPSGQGATGRTDPPPADGPADQATTAAWRGVLDAIDGRRQRAWHRGDPSALARVFVAGSAELTADRRALVSYVRRGLHVDGVATSYRVMAVKRVGAGSAALLVVDRLGQAVARDDSGHHAVLPTDRPSRQRISLRLIDGVWLIASVQDLEPALP